MSRPKGKAGAAIRRLDPKEQGDVAMRDILWLGASLPSLNRDLGELERKRKRLTVELLNTSRENKSEAIRALSNTNKQIEQVQKQIEEAKRLTRSRRTRAVYPWQERAAALIAIHKYLDRDSDHVASTHGSTIT